MTGQGDIMYQFSLGQQILSPSVDWLVFYFVMNRKDGLHCLAQIHFLQQLTIVYVIDHLAGKHENSGVVLGNISLLHS